MSGGMEFVSGVGMRGDLCVRVKDAKTGELLRTYEIRNKITLLAANVLVELIAQRAADPAPLADSMFSMRMGSANTQASRADTNLGSVVIGKQLLDVNKVSGANGELQFVAQLVAGDANGITLQEAGLFTRGLAAVPTALDPPDPITPRVRMFARQIHPPIPKTSAITLEYSWRIAFTA